MDATEGHLVAEISSTEGVKVVSMTREEMEIRMLDSSIQMLGCGRSRLLKGFVTDEIPNFCSRIKPVTISMSSSSTSSADSNIDKAKKLEKLARKQQNRDRNKRK